MTGEAPIVDPEKTDVSQVVSAGFVSNLPIDGRRWENFVLLTPNATTDGDSGLVSYRGISGLYNASAVDGANNNVQLWSETRGRATGIAYVYSQDSIQEFRASAANYSAEMGGAAGGINNAITNSGTNSGPPGVTLSNVMNYGMPNALPRIAEPDEHRNQIADTLSITHGTHTFKAGFDLNLIHEVMINLFHGGGVYSYTGTAQTVFNNWVADITGTNFGDGLTGRHWTTFTMSTDPITGRGEDNFWMKDPAFFFEDTWKVRKNLTLTLGMRYEVQFVPQPPKPNLNTPLTTYYRSTINIDSNNSVADVPHFCDSFLGASGNRSAVFIWHGMNPVTTHS